MINECNRKIVDSMRQMKASPEGREKFMKMMEQSWRKLLPAGHDTLGWEQFQQMQDLMAPEIDKINAPH